MASEYSYSFDEENYEGPFPSREAAIAEALKNCEGDSFWTGENFPPEDGDDEYEWYVKNVQKHVHTGDGVWR